MKTVWRPFPKIFKKRQKDAARGREGINTQQDPERQFYGEIPQNGWALKRIYAILPNRRARTFFSASLNGLSRRFGFDPNRYGQRKQSVPVQVQTFSRHWPTHSRQWFRIALSGANGFFVFDFIRCLVRSEARTVKTIRTENCYTGNEISNSWNQAGFSRRSESHGTMRNSACPR